MNKIEITEDEYLDLLKSKRDLERAKRMACKWLECEIADDTISFEELNEAIYTVDCTGLLEADLMKALKKYIRRRFKY